MSTTHPGTDWMTHALCARNLHLGWLNDPETVGVGEEATMSVICSRCPVHTQCEAYAQATDITGGFWAGHHRTPEGPLLPLVEPSVTGDAA
jgi:hypothetical protein